MNLIRLLLILILCAIVWQFLKRWLAGPSQDQTRSSTENLQQMVRCEHCGLHIPKQEAIVDRDKYYCCPEHRDAKH